MDSSNNQSNIHVRFTETGDITALYNLFKDEPFAETKEKFQAYFDQAQEDICIFAVAEFGGKVCSMVSIHFKPADFAPMDSNLISQSIPEVKSLQTAPGFEGKGAASALMDFIEAEARRRGYNNLGVSVGLHASYGKAQRMYAKRGYILDGRGVSYDGQTVPPGEMVRVDDSLT